MAINGARLVAALACVAGVCGIGNATAQSADEYHPKTVVTQAEQVPPGMMSPGMMAMMQGHMGRGAGTFPMKVFFAIADTNGDGALSFEEVTAIHKRIFDAMDANRDGKVTLEEIQTFMRD